MLYTPWDWETALRVRYEEGVEEGYIEGLKLSMGDDMVGIAKAMKARKIGNNEIIRQTGLSVEDVLKL